MMYVHSSLYVFYTSFVLVTISCFHYSPDHWLYYVKYMNCQIKCHFASEGCKDGDSSIIEAKDFIKYNKSVEEAKKSGRYSPSLLTELEFIWKLQNLS